MKFKYYLKTKIPFFMALIGLVGLSSCGAYKYVGQDNDGIYDSSNKQIENKQQVATTDNNDNKDYYKNYFKQKSNELGTITQEEDVIFTDVDSYEGNYTEAPVAQNQVESYPGWGQENSNVSVNVYPNAGFGFNNWGWNGWGWNRWNRGFGWGIGWNNPWAFGGFYDPFWCSPFYGGGFYGRGFYGRGFYGRGFNRYGYANNYYGRGLAYTDSRRNSISRQGFNSRRSSSVRTRTNSSNSRARTSSSRANTSRGNTIRTRPSRSSNSGTIRTRPSSGSRSISRPSKSSGGRTYSSGRSSGGRSYSSGRSSGGRSYSSGRSRGRY